MFLSIRSVRVLLLAALLLGACVPTGRYDEAVMDAQRAHVQVEEARSRAVADEEQTAHLRAALDDAASAAVERDRRIHELDTTSSLEQAKARLDELRRARAPADARAALFHQLALKFQKMIDAGELKVLLRDGRMVIELTSDVLFDSGQTELKPAGQAALRHVASVLHTLEDRRFQVAGDTDNVPIQTPRFPSNWELSTARAVEVVRFLVAQGLRPEVLSAAGYGEFDPVASNDDPSGRAKNRRIEISLQPNIDELVAVPKG